MCIMTDDMNPTMPEETTPEVPIAASEMPMETPVEPMAPEAPAMPEEKPMDTPAE